MDSIEKNILDLKRAPASKLAAAEGARFPRRSPHALSPAHLLHEPYYSPANPTQRWLLSSQYCIAATQAAKHFFHYLSNWIKDVTSGRLSGRTKTNRQATGLSTRLVDNTARGNGIDHETEKVASSVIAIDREKSNVDKE